MTAKEMDMSHCEAVPPAPETETEVLPEAFPPAAGIPSAAYGPGAEPTEQYDSGDSGAESFVPRPRYRMVRSTKVMACVLLLVLGAFGGALMQKAVDGGSARSSRSALFNGSGFGAGAGGGANGGGSAGTGTNQTSVNGTNGAGQNGTTGQGRRSRQSGSSSGAGSRTSGG